MVVILKYKSELSDEYFYIFKNVMDPASTEAFLTAELGEEYEEGSTEWITPQDGEELIRLLAGNNRRHVKLGE